jgi:hypothetical protein
MSKLPVLLLVVGALLLLLTPRAAANGPTGCSFSGSVKLDAAEVADGTLITAVIDGDEYHTHTSTGYGYSTYFITIRPPEGTSYPDGSKVVLKVNGHPATQTAIYKVGASTRLDLTASAKSIAAPVNISLTILFILLILAAAGIGCYLFFRIMVRRKKLVGTVAAVQPEKVTAQTRDRYIWDNNKLAWVETTEHPRQKLLTDVNIEGESVEEQPAAKIMMAKRPGIKRTKAAKFPRRDTSLFGMDA